ncbi:MAG TPA: MarR family transcriptional regulator [Caulobacteraceae bacterium]|nr:MarR family transcriptional regulator [Caulobacteraceae bacterium]
MTRLRTANLLGALSGEVTHRLERQLKRHPNQTSSSAAALNVIGFWEGCSNSELSSALRLSHTATVRLVDKLEADGLVEARPGRDRRAVALHLTGAGREAVQRLLTERCAALEQVTTALTAEESQVFAGLLEKLLRSVTPDMTAATQICRLCDETVCPEETCPVHQAALAAEAS